ncbi:type VII secretion target [Nocardia beijingensis]|uniref:type VII secretion target n=1 Tax=Nocardia beijingensis TaxID=95162 RepID=UPI0033D6088A
MTSIRVVPEALRHQARAVAEAATYWDQAKKEIQSHPMRDHALGVLVDDVPQMFNKICEQVVDHFERSRASIQSAGDGLSNCATVYEQKDHEWYRQFGYLDE